MNQSFSKDKLVGYWRSQLGYNVCHLRLHDDGTFKATITKKRKGISLTHGTWALEDNRLTMIYIEDKFNVIPRGLRAEDTLIEVTDDFFVVQSRHGPIEKYERVPEADKPAV